MTASCNYLFSVSRAPGNGFGFASALFRCSKDAGWALVCLAITELRKEYRATIEP